MHCNNLDTTIPLIPYPSIVHSSTSSLCNSSFLKSPQLSFWQELLPSASTAQSSCDSAAMLEAVLGLPVSVSFLYWFEPPRSWPSFQQAVRSTGEELFPSGAECFSSPGEDLACQIASPGTELLSAWLGCACCAGIHFGGCWLEGKDPQLCVATITGLPTTGPPPCVVIMWILVLDFDSSTRAELWERTLRYFQVNSAVTYK